MGVDNFYLFLIRAYPSHKRLPWLPCPRGEASVSYRKVFALEDLRNYLTDASVVAFDFATSPDAPYRHEGKPLWTLTKCAS
jgi:hypothetical protein